MGLLEAVLLGAVQGVTEFLPISSTAHLRVIPALLGWKDPGVTFTAVIQLGSLVAIIAYFAKDLRTLVFNGGRELLTAKWHAPDARLAIAIMLATLPICIFGLVFKGVLETADGPLRSLAVIGLASLSMAVLLWLSERFGSRSKSIAEIGMKEAIIIGLGQSLALIAGCSRSGSTLTAGLFAGLRREDAARFSFLLGVPAIMLSGAVELHTMMSHYPEQLQDSSLWYGVLSATVFSYASISWLMRFLRTHSTAVFIVYRIVFGLGLLGLVTVGFKG